MILDSLDKLFAHELKDLYSAENQIIKALPRMISAASNADLKASFQEHLTETEEHVARLETIFKSLKFEPGGHHCNGMEGLVAEAKDMIAADATDAVRDAGLISAANRIEHYEMAGYGTAVALAEQLGHQDAADALNKTLDEEGAADRKLSRLATRFLNFKAQVG